MALNRYVGPPIPGRHTELTAQLIDAIDGTTSVATGDDQLLTIGGNDELLTAAFQSCQL